MESIKKHLFKLVLISTAVLLFVGCIYVNADIGSVYAEELIEGDYRYTVTDEKATITKYIGSGGRVTIPDELGGYPVTVIGEGSFSAYTYDLSSVVIPDSVETIESVAFSGCQRLQGVTFGSGLKSIGGYAFYNCRLSDVTLPEGLTSIGGSAFEKGCAGSVYIPGTVEKIGSYAFSKSSISTLTFGDGVGEVAGFAFNECSIGNAVLKGSVDKFKKDAFRQSYGKRSVYVEDLAAWLKIEFENLYASPMGYGGTFYVDGKNINGKMVIPEEISDCSGFNLSMMGLKTVMLLSEKFPVSKFTSSSNKMTIYAHDVNGNKASVENAGHTFVDLANFDCENGNHCYEFYGVTNVQEISCFQDGISTETCALCGDVKETVTEKWKHQFTENWRVAQYPTCSQEGLEYRTCLICREFEETRPIEKKEHSLRTLEGKEATCTQTGLTEGKYCYRCDAVVVSQNVITKKAHTVTADKAVKATFTETGLTEGSHCSVCGKIIAAQKTVAKLILGQVSGLKAKKVKVAKSSEITLAWNKMTGAEKYEVYQQNGKSWKKIKTTSSTSLTVKKLKANKSYKFKVRAVVDDIKGKYSSVITVKTVPATTSKLTLKAGKKQLTASWKSVSDISGYEVQYSTSKKFTKKTTKTVTAKKSAKKTTIKKLKKGKKYYVRVRTYKTVNGKKVYSSWSAVKNVKVK